MFHSRTTIQESQTMTLEQRCIVVFLILLTTEYSVECGSFSFQRIHPRNRQILEHMKQRLEQQMAETSTTTVVTTSETTTTTMSTTTTTTTTTTLSSISSKVNIENCRSGRICTSIFKSDPLQIFY